MRDIMIGAPKPESLLAGRARAGAGDRSAPYHSHHHQSCSSSSPCPSMPSLMLHGRVGRVGRRCASTVPSDPRHAASRANERPERAAEQHSRDDAGTDSAAHDTGAGAAQALPSAHAREDSLRLIGERHTIDRDSSDVT